MFQCVLGCALGRIHKSRLHTVQMGPVTRIGSVPFRARHLVSYCCRSSNASNLYEVPSFFPFMCNEAFKCDFHPVSGFFLLAVALFFSFAILPTIIVNTHMSECFQYLSNYKVLVTILFSTLIQVTTHNAVKRTHCYRMLKIWTDITIPIIKIY